ncbi:hypothetical protein ILUMI_02433 [Ignelater luminosus]|uniref:Uncharacterized protein n=1 Tax=Ignelater luminosus TaxID=2038154 RepID=A0A8K0DCK0_IGNLU|nr:hypothetical protein ILUMI_02433 [Ignelater luminosus]
MNQTIEAVRENAMGWLMASERFNVPQAKFRCHYQHVLVNLSRYKPIFDSEMEEELANHILDLEGRLFGLNIIEVKKLAYEFAERAALDRRFEKINQTAGWE